MEARNHHLHDGVLGRYVMEHAEEALVLLDRHGGIATMNRAARTMLAGVDLLSVLDGACVQSSNLVEFRAALQSTGRARAELFVTSADGSPRCLMIDGTYIDGHQVLTVREVRAPLSVDDEVNHLRRVQSSALLARSVAHEFNNLLTPILHLSARLADGRYESVANANDLAREVSRAAERAAGLARQMMSFARRGPPRVEPINVNDVVQDMARLTESMLGEGIELELDLQEPLGETLVDRERLENAIVSLVVNAHDAMPYGGRLILRTQTVVRPRDATYGRSAPGSRRYVALSVIDSGLGSVSELQQRLIKKFFASREAGHSTGVGLTTAQRFVIESGGFVAVEREPSRGTRVMMHLPQA